ncbi:MAG TPA: hypothetical protein VGI39_33490 [Polyangiaceae bacterium]
MTLPSHVRRTPLLSLLFLAACSGASSPSSSTVSSKDESPPWGAQSKSVALTCGSFFDGSMRFQSDRAHLSDAQLALLDKMTVDAAPEAGCAEDVMGCSIVITEEDGTSKTYVSTEGGNGCSSAAKPAIAYEQVSPLLQTISCRYSKAALTSDPAAPPPVVPDARCYDGMFTGGTGTIGVQLQVTAPGPRHIELAGCNGENQAGKLSASITGPAPSTPIAIPTVSAANAGLDGTCASLDTTFDAAGTYTLGVTIEDGFLPVGDFWLRYY